MLLLQWWQCILGFTFLYFTVDYYRTLPATLFRCMKRRWPHFNPANGIFKINYLYVEHLEETLAAQSPSHLLGCPGLLWFPNKSSAGCYLLTSYTFIWNLRISNSVAGAKGQMSTNRCASVWVCCEVHILYNDSRGCRHAVNWHTELW